MDQETLGGDSAKISVAGPTAPARPNIARKSTGLAEAKDRQSRKIREVKIALVSEGILSLDDQAEALGLARSTAWFVLKGDHKASGLSASVVNRMLASPGLPAEVRRVISEYAREKADGLYGHGAKEVHRFRARIGLGNEHYRTESRPLTRASL